MRMRPSEAFALFTGKVDGHEATIKRWQALYQNKV
jgi:hypothetical protein